MKVADEFDWQRDFRLLARDLASLRTDLQILVGSAPGEVALADEMSGGLDAVMADLYEAGGCTPAAARAAVRGALPFRPRSRGAERR